MHRWASSLVLVERGLHPLTAPLLTYGYMRSIQLLSWNTYHEQGIQLVMLVNKMFLHAVSFRLKKNFVFCVSLFKRWDAIYSTSNCTEFNLVSLHQKIRPFFSACKGTNCPFPQLRGQNTKRELGMKDFVPPPQFFSFVGRLINATMHKWR